MYLRVTSFVLALCLIPAAAFAQRESPRVPNLDADEIEELMDGDAIVDTERGEGVNRGDVIGLIHAPMDEVWEIVQDFENLDRWFPDMQDTELVGSDLGQGGTNMPWPVADRRWQIELDREEGRVVDGITANVAWWTCNQDYEDSNVDDTYGYWLVYTWPDNPEYTLVRYVINADLGIWLPDPVIRWATRRLLPGMVEGLQERHDELY